MNNLFVKRSLVSIALTLSALLSLVYWWNLSRPVVLADALSDHLSCVSYSPYHKPGQTPLDPNLNISTEQIDADLTALAERFNCVRIYTVTHGMQEVPRVAQKLGMKVLLGIWIGRETEINEVEIQVGIHLAHQYTSAILAVIVGNEVLLRREQTPAKMREYIKQVKAAVGDLPVTYADVWEFWLRYQQDLLGAVSFATVHILPYWEDDPIGIDQAVAHVSQIYKQVKTELKGKEVLIGETGWPSYGRQRQAAEPSLINEARFIREFSLLSEQENMPYNVIEAFDQPWKRQSEGAVGGYWGIFSADDGIKFPFQGAVAEAPSWSYASYALMFIVFALLGLLQWRRQQLTANNLWPLLTISISSAGAWLAFCRDLFLTNRNSVEWLFTLLYAGLLLALILLLAQTLSAWFANQQPPQTPTPIHQLVRSSTQQTPAPDHGARYLGLLRFLFLFSASLVCLLLIFDIHPRDFPLALFSVPAIGLALLSAISQQNSAEIEEILLASWIACAGVWIIINEHLVTVQDKPWHVADGLNMHAVEWGVLCLTLAGSVLGPVYAQHRLRHAQNLR